LSETTLSPRSSTLRLRLALPPSTRGLATAGLSIINGMSASIETLVWPVLSKSRAKAVLLAVVLILPRSSGKKCRGQGRFYRGPMAVAGTPPLPRRATFMGRTVR
jgi:hypothetical protein